MSGVPLTPRLTATGTSISGSRRPTSRVADLVAVDRRERVPVRHLDRRERRRRCPVTGPGRQGAQRGIEHERPVERVRGRVGDAEPAGQHDPVALEQPLQVFRRGVSTVGPAGDLPQAGRRPRGEELLAHVVVGGDVRRVGHAERSPVPARHRRQHGRRRRRRARCRRHRHRPISLRRARRGERRRAAPADHDRAPPARPWLHAAVSMLAPYRVLDLTDGRAELATLRARGTRRRRGQGRAARRRDVTVRGRARRRRAAGAGRPALPRLQPGQAQRRARPRRARRPPRPAGPGGDGRLRGRERRTGRDGRPRARLRGVAGGQGRPRLRRHLPVRPDRPVRPPRRDRPHALGDGRRDGAQRRAPTAGPCASRCRRRGTTPPSRARVAALVANERRRQTGEAQFVDVSVQASVFWTGLKR